VVPQLRGGWKYNYPTKQRQACHANEQFTYSLMSMGLGLSFFVALKERTKVC